jgi:hypothetical protein
VFRLLASSMFQKQRFFLILYRFNFCYLVSAYLYPGRSVCKYSFNFTSALSRVLSADRSKLNVIFSYIPQHYKTRQSRRLLEVQVKINYLRYTNIDRFRDI